MCNGGPQEILAQKEAASKHSGHSPAAASLGKSHPLYLLAGTLAQAEALAALVNERGIKRVVLVR